MFLALSFLVASLPVAKIAAVAYALLPAACWSVIGAVILNDVLDYFIAKKMLGHWPGVDEFIHLASEDVANKVIIAVAVSAGLAYFGATGDKVGAARAVFVAGCVASAAVEENGIRVKLASLFVK